MSRSPQELAQTVTDAVSELVWAGRVVGDQASCVVCDTFWPHHEEGCFAGELENNAKALAEAGERAQEALRPLIRQAQEILDVLASGAEGYAPTGYGYEHMGDYTRDVRPLCEALVALGDAS